MILLIVLSILSTLNTPGDLKTNTDTVIAHYKPARVINLNGVHDITISGKAISGGKLPLVKLSNCYNVRITHNKLSGSKDVGIYLYKCKNITIDSNTITNVSSGVYAQLCAGGNIVVEHNRFINMQGPFPRGQFVQFNAVNGAGNSISYNHGQNNLGKSYPEDAISLFKSNGTEASPIKVSDNYIRGGGPSPSGGGIMLGDNGGSWQAASGNILINPGQYGMAISGGSHISIINNTIFAAQQSFTNVGIYVQSVGQHKVSSATVTANKVRYYNKNNMMNNSWLAPGTDKPAGWDDNFWGAAIDELISINTMP